MKRRRERKGGCGVSGLCGVGCSCGGVWGGWSSVGFECDEGWGCRGGT